MREKGLRDSTVKNTRKDLLFLSRNVVLANPEDVKGFIARLDMNDSYKRNLSIAYNNYAKVHDISWIYPRYYASSKLPKIPSEEKRDMIIANPDKKRLLELKEKFLENIDKIIFGARSGKPLKGGCDYC
jgi:hypothetical protein